MLIDQFNAKRPKHTGNKKQLVFDIDKLNRMANKYNLDVDIKVVNKSNDSSGTIVESNESDESLVGLDRHFSDTNNDTENVGNKEESENITDFASETNANIDSDNTAEADIHDNNPTQATQPT